MCKSQSYGFMSFDKTLGTHTQIKANNISITPKSSPVSLPSQFSTLVPKGNNSLIFFPL